MLNSPRFSNRKQGFVANITTRPLPDWTSTIAGRFRISAAPFINPLSTAASVPRNRISVCLSRSASGPWIDSSGPLA